MNVCQVLKGADCKTEGNCNDSEKNEQDRDQAGKKRGTDDSAVFSCQRAADEQSYDNDRVDNESDQGSFHTFLLLGGNFFHLFHFAVVCTKTRLKDLRNNGSDHGAAQERGSGLEEPVTGSVNCHSGIRKEVRKSIVGEAH